jgi:hypothetical protein
MEQQRFLTSDGDRLGYVAFGGSGPPALLLLAYTVGRPNGEVPRSGYRPRMTCMRSTSVVMD